MTLAVLCCASASSVGEVGCSPVGFHKNLFEWRRSQEEERMETLMGHSGPDHMHRRYRGQNGYINGT